MVSAPRFPAFSGCIRSKIIMANIFITPMHSKYCEEYIDMEYDFDVKKYVGGAPNRSKDDLRDHIASADSDGLYAIVKCDSGHFVGRCGYLDCEDCLEIYVLIAKKYWGKGYAKEAVIELLKTAGDKKVVAIIDPDNIVSIKLFGSLGFKEIGKVASGGYQNNHIKYGLL